jgi:flagellar hook-basal body complex protein FliE
MANLNVSNLNSIVQSGDVEKLFSGNASTAASELLKDSQAGAVSPNGLHENATNFSDILKQSVDKVNLYQIQADTAIKELVAGRNKNIHETMLTIERADTSLKLMMQVRNKVLDAYREIMRMQV